jgi:hypothetical protein
MELRQGLGLPPAPVQREHVLATQLLVQRMVTGELGQFADDLSMASGDQVRLDAQHLSGQPRLLEGRDARLEEYQLVRDVSQQWPAPQAKRLPQQQSSLARIPGNHLTRRIRQRHEPYRVEGP